MLDASTQAEKPPRGLSHWYHVWLIGLITLITLVAVLVSQTWLERHMIGLAGETLTLTATDIASKLDLLLSQRAGDIQVFAETLAMNGGTSAERLHLLESFQQAYPLYRWIGVTDATGHIIEATDPETRGRDVHEADWFQAIRRGEREVHIGALHGDRVSDSRETIAFSAPVIDHRRTGKNRPFRGVVSSRMEIVWIDTVVREAFQAVQKRMSVFQAVEYQVVWQDGTALVDSHRGSADAEPAELSGLPSVQRAASGDAGFVEETHVRRQVPVLTGYASTQKRDVSGTLRWTILLRVDRDEIVGPVRRLFWVGGSAALLIVGPLIVLLMRATRRVQVEWREAHDERWRSKVNERRLGTLLEVVPEGLVVLDEGRRVQRVNPAACALFDARFPEELLGHDLARYLHDDDRHAYEHAHAMALHGRSVSCTGRLTGLTGELRWFDLAMVSLPDEHGGNASVLCVTRDMTEERHAERRQILQHAVAKVLAEASTVEQALPELLRVIATSLEWQVGLFWQVQEEARVLACTEVWGAFPSPVESFLVASRREVFASGVGFPGRCWARGEPIWEPDVLRDQDFVRRAPAVTSGIHAGCAFPVWLRTNVFGIMEFYSREVQPRDADLLRALGTIGSQIGLFLERAEVEAALRENETRTRLIIDTALDAVVTMDQSGLITEWNAQAEHLFGWKAHEVMGRDLAEILIPAPQRAAHRAGLARYLATRHSAILGRLVEFHACDREGRAFPVEVSIAPLQMEESVIFSAFIRDISVRKESEQALSSYAHRMEQTNRELDDALVQAREATEAKSAFLATMSHEIRTPMNGVIGMTSLLLDTELTPEQREFAEMVRKCGDHLLTVINDILDFSKIEAGKMTLERIEFNLRETVEDALEVLGERASSKRLNLACLFAGTVPSALRGDPGRVRQVLTNLIGNAVKFTEQGDVVVRVSVVAQTHEDAQLRFDVADTGIGLSVEQQARLFQAFSQADGSTTRRYGGTGLGLAICKRLVELMEGEIGVTSQLGAGSTFWFTARFERLAVQPVLPDAELARLAGQRVLVVDERAVNRDILQTLLVTWGMIVSTASNGEAALTAVRDQQSARTPFHLALVDSEIRVGMGRLLTEALAEDVDAAPRQILMRAVGRRVEGRSGQDRGVVGVLSKPIREGLLFRCVVDAIMDRGTPAQSAALPVPVVAASSLIERAGPVPSLSILLVEDHLINQQLALRMLGRMGHRVTVAVNGLEAVAAVSKARYDLVLMDCQMPEMDGFQATRAIREWEARQLAGGMAQRVPIIAMTADVLHATRAQCMQAGMDDCVFKPVATDVLAAVVERWASANPTGNPAPRRVSLEGDGASGSDESGFSQRLGRHFLADTPKRLTTIRMALSRARFGDVRRMVQTLKRSAAALRLFEVVRPCERMLAETRATEPRVETLTPLFAELEQAFAQSKEQLQRDLEEAA